jgi:hypothetical protein
MLKPEQMDALPIEPTLRNGGGSRSINLPDTDSASSCLKMKMDFFMKQSTGNCHLIATYLCETPAFPKEPNLLKLTSSVEDFVDVLLLILPFGTSRLWGLCITVFTDDEEVPVEYGNTLAINSQGK